jgi:UV DNA damage endonuclease
MHPENRYGYACINTHLRAQRISCNRSMIKRTWLARGIKYASELCLANARDLRRIVQWNIDNDIQVYRITSDLFPWASEYRIDDLPDIEAIADVMADTGRLARDSGQRLSMHPGQFVCLASPKPDVVLNAAIDLENHGKMMDLLGQPRSRQAKINIHLGGVYGDHESAMSRFVDNLSLLSDSVLTRLTIENDDKPGCYSTSMLHRGVFERAGVPIVFDTLHYACGPDDLPINEAVELAVSTWPTDVRPTCHHSSSRKLHEDPSQRSIAAHADFIYDTFPTTSRPVDVVIECKAKERGTLRFIEQYVAGERFSLAS